VKTARGFFNQVRVAGMVAGSSESGFRLASSVMPCLLIQGRPWNGAVCSLLSLSGTHPVLSEVYCGSGVLPGNRLAPVIDEVMPTLAGEGIDLIDQPTRAGLDVYVGAFPAHIRLHPARMQRQYSQ